MKKRAQLAVETLLIYGIAILIVMLAVGALVAFGVLDLGGLLPDQCQLGDALSCENYVVLEDSVQLELRNTLGKNIQNFTVSIKGEGNNLGLWGCNETDYTTILVNGEITNVVTLPCDIKVHVGKKIEGVMSVSFYPVGSSIARTSTGKIRASVS